MTGITASRDTVFERAKPSDSIVRDSLRDSRQSVYWLDSLAPTPGHPSLVGSISADLAVVGGGYCGLWTAVLAKRRDPSRRVVLLEGKTIGWAASGRNGGFLEASLTHGEANGQKRWPNESAVLDQLGKDNLESIQLAVHDLHLSCEFERSGALSVATEPHQVEWLRQSDNFLGPEQTRAVLNSPTFLAASWDKHSTALVHPAKLAKELARVASDLGVEIFEHSPATSIESARTGPVTVNATQGKVVASQLALATNAFPSLLKSQRLMTVPVYDYVLMSEPLGSRQLASIGWSSRQGVVDLANQFHYYRLTADNRILWGGYDAIYHGRRIRSRYENRPQTFAKLASHFFTTFPQLAGLKFTHRWAGAIDTSTQFCAFFGLARGGRVASASGFTGLGVAATHFAAEVMLDQLAGQPTIRTELEMVRRQPLPFPPDPVARIGIEATRWALNQADHRQGRRNVFLRALDAAGLGFDS